MVGVYMKVTVGTLPSAIEKACAGDHVMVACRSTGSDKLTLAAHAPRDDVFSLQQGHD